MKSFAARLREEWAQVVALKGKKRWEFIWDYYKIPILLVLFLTVTGISGGQGGHPVLRWGSPGLFDGGNRSCGGFALCLGAVFDPSVRGGQSRPGRSLYCAASQLKTK